MDGSTSAKQELEGDNIDEQTNVFHSLSDLDAVLHEPSPPQACITKNGPWGGNTGESHEINVELEPAYLHSITLRSGETIHAIAFSFSDKDGNPHHAGPWGATAHQPTGSFDTILLGPTEHLIKISGTVGMSTQHSCDVVTSLTFSTNISVYGPFGREDGIPFSFQTMGIGSIVGFFVRAMAMVNAIGTYVNSTRQPMRTRGLIMKIGPWGSNGGTLFDVDVLPRRLVSMVIRSGKLIDSISFTYSDCDGQQHIAGPWGGHGTHDRDDGSIHTIVLGRSEFLKKISGTIGPSPHPYLVNSLLFITNTGSYGPFGRGRGIPFCSPVLTNSSIVGFFVRSGWYIDAIGLYVDAIEETDNGGASSASPNPEGQIEELNMPCITKIGLWGGEKGSLRDIDVSPICLNSIKICSGEVIHSFAFSYSDDHGKQHHAGPWGSYEGSFDMIQLGPSELLIQVSGTVGSFSRYTQDVAVTSLTFTTNARRYGPFGRGGGVQFHSPGMSNGNITGFFARSGGVIDAIGIYVNRGQAMEKRGLIRKIGPWGGTKGKPKDIEETPLYLNSVTIRSGELVYSLAFSYTDGHGKQHHAGPWGSYEVSSYGNFHTIQLSPSEFLTEVSGTIGFPPRYPAHVVTSVKFITNARGIGPFGTGGGHHFRSPPLSKGSIVGFFAYVGKALNAIGLYVNPEKQPIREPGLATKVGPWGGDSGRSGDVAVLPQRLISVVVCSGKVINSLSFTYSGCDGQVHTAGPWGGMDESQGGSSDTILLGDSEILMKISGTVGQSPDHLDVVTSLLFVTNVRSYGRYGEGGGNRFQSPRQRDGGIVGFFANAGDVIGAIGVYFSPQGETIDEEEEGGSGTSDLMASRERVTKPASSTLETIILDKRAEPTNLPLALFQYITGNFADEREIGRGGFGVVYKGDLDNGSNVAVKRLLNCHIIDEKEFNLEASSLIGVNHKNIVRFLGYCANTESKAMLIPESGGALKYIFAEIRERLLCFEYISNGSLEQYLTDELKGLEWHKRYQIIRGICEGLVYLHKETDIVHMDMKPANILLDDLMIPKISDFGISKILEGATHAVTANRKWSLGYCAPEFINSGEVSTKLDIYSLGIIITELLTGCKGNLDIKHVLRRWRYRWNKSVNYPPFGYEQVKLCTEIALRCLSNSPRERPQIWDIVSMLDTIESTNEQINNASDSPVELISPYPWELLEFDMLELNFPFEINKQIPCSLQLKNVTDDYIAFDTKTAGRLQYSIEPEKGVVPPRSKCDVMVKLQAQERAPNATTCKDEFFMRCAAVNEGVTALDITEDMFDKNSGKLVDEVTLKVIIEPLANA